MKKGFEGLIPVSAIYMKVRDGVAKPAFIDKNGVLK